MTTQLLDLFAARGTAPAPQPHRPYPSWLSMVPALTAIADALDKGGGPPFMWGLLLTVVLVLVYVYRVDWG